MTIDIEKVVFSKKTYLRPEVEQHLKNLEMENKKMKENKSNYSIQLHPKSHFSDKLQKHKVDRHITVHYGELKPQYQGSGFFSKITDYFKKGVKSVKENLPQIIETTKKVVDVGSKVLFESNEPTEGKFVRDKRMPNNFIMWKIASEAYNKKPKDNIDGWELLCATDTLKFYWKNKVVVCGIRGTASQTDIKADLKIALGNLDKSPRFKKDLEDFKSCMVDVKKFGVDVVFGASHSLGSAICDLFISKGLIEQGVSYNGAIEKKFMGSNKNYRIYLNEDEVLYQTMGKYANAESREVREKSPLKKAISEAGDVGKLGVSLQSHLLDNFQGGKKSDKPMSLKSPKGAMCQCQCYLSGRGRADALIKAMKDGSFQQALDQAPTDKGATLNKLMANVYSQSDFADNTRDWFKTAGQDINTFLKDNKVLSTVADIGTALTAIVPGFEEFSPALALASSGLSSQGYGRPDKIDKIDEIYEMLKEMKGSETNGKKKRRLIMM